MTLISLNSHHVYLEIISRLDAQSVHNLICSCQTFWKQRLNLETAYIPEENHPERIIIQLAYLKKYRSLRITRIDLSRCPELPSAVALNAAFKSFPNLTSFRTGLQHLSRLYNPATKQREVDIFETWIPAEIHHPSVLLARKLTLTDYTEDGLDNFPYLREATLHRSTITRIPPTLKKLTLDLDRLSPELLKFPGLTVAVHPCTPTDALPPVKIITCKDNNINAELAWLAKYCPGSRTIDLRGSLPISRSIYTSIGAMNRLQVLNINTLVTMGDDELDKLCHLDLVELHAADSPLTNRGIATIASSFPSLQKLSICVSQLDPSPIFQKHPNLTFLKLRQAILAEMPLKKLTHLDLVDSQIEKLPNPVPKTLAIGTIDEIIDERITDAFLGTLKNMQGLLIFNTAVTAAKVREILANSPNLTQFAFSCGGFTDADMPLLSQFQLTYLNLDNNPITNEGVRGVGFQPKLEELSLACTRIDRGTFSYASDFPNLKKINLFCANPKGD